MKADVGQSLVAGASGGLDGGTREVLRVMYIRLDLYLAGQLAGGVKCVVSTSESSPEYAPRIPYGDW